MTCSRNYISKNWLLGRKFRQKQCCTNKKVSLQYSQVASSCVFVTAAIFNPLIIQSKVYSNVSIGMLQINKFQMNSTILEHPC
jgi:hypothetical protein